MTFIAGDSPQSTPDTAPTSQHLQTRMDDNGKLVVFGHDLGHDWEIRLNNGVTQFFVDGVENPGGGFSSPRARRSTSTWTVERSRSASNPRA